jgi:hypothetical protein
MNSEIQVRLLGAVRALLRPVARLLMRYGVTYHQFADIAKEAFVHEAFLDTDSRGRKTNASRVAVKTGISRKEVSRLRDALHQGDSTGRADHSGPPARVLHAWHSDQRYLSPGGTPRALFFDGPDSSFSSLVRLVAGDVPPGAVRAELRKAGAISESEDGRIFVEKRYYVPGNVDEKAITVLANLLFPLAAGIEHNSNPERKADGFIQRFAFSERLKAESIPEFRAWSRNEATDFIESVDDWIAAHEGDAAPDSEHDSASIAGIGVFYYEGPSADGSIRK